MHIEEDVPLTQVFPLSMENEFHLLSNMDGEENI